MVFLGRRLNNEEFVEEAMGIMFAGSGTTSSTLTYLLYAISRPENRAVQERLREEIQSTTDQIDAIRNLPYLNAVIKETFRLYPTIISTLPRTLDEPLTLEGYILPAGTIISMQNFVHHRDRAIFADPDFFLPERWLESTKEMEAALTPFGIEPRSCIGQNLAWEELYIAISVVLNRVALSLGEEMREEDMEMEDRFNIAPKGKKLMLKVVSI